MIDKRLIAIAAGVVAVASVQFANIYVPENFENPTFYKVLVTVSKLTSIVSKIGQFLGIDDEIKLYRRIHNSIISLKPKNYLDGSVQVQYKVLDDVPVRVYTPKEKSETPLPVLMYFHGGGYVIGSVEQYDQYCHDLAKHANIVVVSVEYRYIPEHPLPEPINDCYKATLYVLNNPNEFNIDKERAIIAGDSAGGHAAAVVTLRLVKEKVHKPKLQLLIYPRLQFYTFSLPSQIFYSGKSLFDYGGFNGPRLFLLALGIRNNSQKYENLLFSNKHLLLIENSDLRKKYQSYFDVNLIPEKYKTGKIYYEGFTNDKMQQLIYPTEVEEDSPIKQDKKFAELASKLLTPELSPVLEDPEILKLLPKTYLLVCEFDLFKDQNLIYAERLRLSGVNVEVEFYENGFHGVAAFASHPSMKLPTIMFNNMVEYLKNNI